MSKSVKTITARKFDEVFDKPQEITKYLNLKAIKINYPVQRINVDMPKDMLQRVDQEAARIGVPRTSLIKIWISERLQQKTA